MEKEVYDSFVIISEQLARVEKKVDTILEIFEDVEDELDDITNEQEEERVEKEKSVPHVTAKKKEKD